MTGCSFGERQARIHWNAFQLRVSKVHKVHYSPAPAQSGAVLSSSGPIPSVGVSVAAHTFHEPSCPVLPLHPLLARTSIPFSTLLSKPTRRRPGRTSPHILWLPNFNPVILRMQYSPFFKDIYPRRINPRVATKDSQHTSSQPLMSYTRFHPPLARVLA